MGEDAIVVTERGFRDSVLGRVLQIKVFCESYRPLGWREVWEAFVARYPGQWAVECFPPTEELVDGKSVYHLFVCEHPPWGLNIR